MKKREREAFGLSATNLIPFWVGGEGGGKEEEGGLEGTAIFLLKYNSLTSEWSVTDTLTVYVCCVE